MDKVVHSLKEAIQLAGDDDDGGGMVQGRIAGFGGLGALLFSAIEHDLTNQVCHVFQQGRFLYDGEMILLLVVGSRAVHGYLQNLLQQFLGNLAIGVIRTNAATVLQCLNGAIAHMCVPPKHFSGLSQYITHKTATATNFRLSLLHLFRNFT